MNVCVCVYVSLFAQYHGLIGLFFLKNFNYACRVNCIYSGNSKLVISSVNAENHYGEESY